MSEGKLVFNYVTGLSDKGQITISGELATGVSQKDLNAVLDKAHAAGSRLSAKHAYDSIADRIRQEEWQLARMRDVDLPGAVAHFSSDPSGQNQKTVDDIAASIKGLEASIVGWKERLTVIEGDINASNICTDC